MAYRLGNSADHNQMRIIIMKLYLSDIAGFEKHNAVYGKNGFVLNTELLFTIKGKEYQRKVRTKMSLCPTYESTVSFKGLVYIIR